MFLRLLTISRPRFWIYVLGPYLIGISTYLEVGKAAFNNLDIFAWLVYFTLPANLLIYGINDLADSDTDAFNEKKGTYEAKIEASDRKILVYAIILLQLPFIPFLIRASLYEQYAFAVFFVFNACYSLPPIRFKIRPYIDSLSNGFLYGSVGVMGYFAAGGFTLHILPIIAAFIWPAVMHAYSAIPDIKADTQAGIRTIATECGVKGTLWICLAGYVLVGVCLIASGLNLHALLVIPYFVLIAISYGSALEQKSVFTIYKVYPFVTYVVGGLVTYINTHNL